MNAPPTLVDSGSTDLGATWFSAIEDITPGWSATLPLPDYGRVARHPLRITTASQSFQKRIFFLWRPTPSVISGLSLKIDMILLIDSEDAKL
jgi:hypothetical protein